MDSPTLERIDWLNRPGVLLVSCVALVILLLPLVMGQERPTVGATADLQSGRWAVTAIDASGAAARAGLRVGDVVLAVGGRPPERHVTYPGLDLDGARTWTIRRGSGVRTLAVPARPDPTDPILLVVLALAFWGIAVFIRLRRNRDELAARMYWMCLAFAGALALSTPRENDVVWAAALEVLSFGALPALFLATFLRVARGGPPGRRSALTIRVAFGAGIAVAILDLVAGLVGSEWYASLQNLLLYFLVGGFLTGLVALIWGFVRPTSPAAHGQAGALLVGTAAAVLPITVLAIVPAALGLSPPVQPQVAALSTVALPLSLAYVVVRYRFLGIEVVVGRALVYGLMTALLAGCYALGLAALAVARRNGLDESALVTVIFFAAVTATFVPIRDFLRSRIDCLIYRDRYNYATTLRELGDQLASIRPLDEALSVVAEVLTSAMNLEGVAVLLCRGDGTYATEAASGRYAEGTSPELEDRAAGIDANSLEATGSETWIPLVARGERCGYLCLGAKRVPSEFSPGDLDLLHTLASQAAVAVANVLLVERLKAKVEELSLLRDRLLHAQEEQRKRVARDLHDGALHTVLGLARQADSAAYHSAAGSHHPELCD